MTASPPTPDQVFESLRQVIDPEIGCNIVDLGLIYDVQICTDHVFIRMTLTTPGCPMHESLVRGVQSALFNLPGVEEVDVELVWDPPWNPGMMASSPRGGGG
jgi:metal-sulfur cluster biosynthetic enzyme